MTKCKPKRKKRLTKKQIATARYRREVGKMGRRRDTGMRDE